MNPDKLLEQTRLQNLKEIRKAIISKEYDEALQILDFCINTHERC